MPTFRFKAGSDIVVSHPPSVVLAVSRGEDAVLMEVTTPHQHKPNVPRPGVQASSETYELLDRVACDVLSSVNDSWSMRNLASAVASDDRILLGESAVRKRLRDMATRREFNLSRMFLPGRGQGHARFKWKPLDPIAAAKARAEMAVSERGLSE